MADHRDDAVALVTGASRGIGAAVARRLAADGFCVAVNSYPDAQMTALADSLVADIGDLGGQAVMIPADVACADDVDRMFTVCERELGPVRFLVLNAAVTATKSWTEIPMEEWDRIIAVNLRGAFACAQRAFRTSPPDGGAIVTVSSVLAQTGASNSLHYATSKAGLLGFTRSLARELGPAGVRVNGVMPGAIVTEDEVERFPDREAVDRRVLHRQAIARRVIPDDIASVVSFLLSPDSAFITGHMIPVDGGWVLY